MVEDLHASSHSPPNPPNPFNPPTMLCPHPFCVVVVVVVVVVAVVDAAVAKLGGNYILCGALCAMNTTN